MNKLIPFVIARLTEKSSVTAIVTLIAGVTGATLAPEHTDTIVAAVVAVVTAIAVFWGEDKKPE